ncbi:MAG: hypothetical protein B9S32_03580 [Verrucomicrobia bacterium Tous-C9LFEB]|nr:MAG: hypothetical protein B9S32_03580 [Verrucomicrobia bacterium Tous-C9LFEB]
METLDPERFSETEQAPLRTLIDELLEAQQSLSAVERFSQRHAGDAIPAQQKYYRELIPLSSPGPGEQYAFRVNLDACTGCKSCVSGCHSLNGLDEGESWRQVGLLVGDEETESYQQTVTAACHHCVEPACMHGCPVAAYDKDSITGIVRHLDDQCIGCQYCVLKCPYDVPKYHAKKGIVRKCDMCQSRLKVGEAPACVQACPTQAIQITIIRLDEVRSVSGPDQRMIAGAFDSSYTQPTTRYHSKTSSPEHVRSANAYDLRLEPAHYPLVFMLVLTQLSVGLFAAQIVNGFWNLSGNGAGMTLLALAAAILGVISSTLHLGRPLGAWRAFLGLRRSWLSREILIFGAFVPAAMIYTALQCLPEFPMPMRSVATSILIVGVLVFGFSGVFSSVMIYADTQREFWKISTTAWKFFGTTLILGGAAAALFTASFLWIGMVMALLPLKLALESGVFRHLQDGGMTPLGCTARILKKKLGRLVAMRFGVAVLGMGLLVVEIFSGDSFFLRGLALVCLLTGELLERTYFFRAVKAPRMPGMAGS